MGSEVTVSVRTQLMKIVEELDKISEKSRHVSANLKDAGKNIGDSVTEQTKRTTTYLEDLSGIGRRVSDQLKADFKSLASLNALAGALKLSEQFRGSIKETAELSDMIRKLGQTFGIAQSDFIRFQSGITKGLGEIGLSSDVAARAMEGLSQSGTRVRGQESLVGYSKTAGQLASVTRQQGQEGNIAAMMAQTIQARGGNVNDMKQVAAVAEDVRRVFNATGQGAQETLGKMKDMFGGMSKDFRDKISSRGLANLAATGTIGGPQTTKFLEEYLKTSPIKRGAFEGNLGVKGIFGEKGLDIDKFQKAAKEVLGRVAGDPRLAAQTLTASLGLSEDAAEGFVRLSQSLDQVKTVQDQVNQSTGDLTSQYKESMGLGEAFRANINQVKKAIATPLAAATQGLTGLLSGTSQSGLGSAAVVGGGGVLAAMLAGGGLRGLGKGMGMGGLAKGAAIEAATGRQVQPVYVVNAKDIASAAGSEETVSKLGMLTGKAGKFLKGAGMVAGAGALGYEAGGLINDNLIEKTQGTTSEGFQGNIIEQLFFKLDKLIGGESSTTFMKNQKVLVELNKRELKESKQPTRGASN